MNMNSKNRFELARLFMMAGLLLLAMSMTLMSINAHAYGTAVRGTVVATENVPVQQPYGSYNAYNNVPPQCQQYQGGYNNSGYNGGTYAGGAIGGAVGYAVGGHSQAGQILGPVVGSVLGAVIGNHIEQSQNQGQAQACYQAQQQAQAPIMGQRVLVRLSGNHGGQAVNGQVVSVTVTHGNYGPGEHVWVVGYDHLMPAYGN